MALGKLKCLYRSLSCATSRKQFSGLCHFCAILLDSPLQYMGSALPEVVPIISLWRRSHLEEAFPMQCTYFATVEPTIFIWQTLQTRKHSSVRKHRVLFLAMKRDSHYFLSVLLQAGGNFIARRFFLLDPYWNKRMGTLVEHQTLTRSPMQQKTQTRTQT